MSAPPVRDWSSILIDAVTKPGVISKAYRQFWNYSVGNQLLVWFQCLERKIAPGPIHTYRGWQELGRHIKRGEKAINLCMPVTCKAKRQADASDEPEPNDEETFTRFIYRPRWFVLAQTEGTDYVPAELPHWHEDRALVALNAERVNFSHFNGNIQGYALRRTVAISPVAVMPHRTLFHELAHVVLGHTAELGRLDDGEQTPVNLREVEAEAVALICSEALELDGVESSRGYIQHWLHGTKVIPERSAQRIFKAADQILKAGRPEMTVSDEEAMS